MNRMVDLISAVKRETALPDDRFLGVGIAIPSLVSPDGETTVYGMSSNFTGVTRRFFSEYIPYPVKMYHDSETAGFAEIWRTTDRGNMIYLNLNSTTGSSFFLTESFIQETIFMPVNLGTLLSIRIAAADVIVGNAAALTRSAMSRFLSPVQVEA